MSKRKDKKNKKSEERELTPQQQALVAQADAVFGRKVGAKVKIIMLAALVVVVLLSYFLGAYSLRGGYGVGDMTIATINHFHVLFHNLWQEFTAIVRYITSGGQHQIAMTITVDDPVLDKVLFNNRLPRIGLVLLVGAALSTAGASFQGMFKNPLVSPDLLGASAGASLGACLAMLFDLSNIWVQAGAFVGGLCAVALTVWMRGIVKSDAILGLVLAGMLVSTLFQSGMSFVKLVADTNDKLPAITYWLMGSFASGTRQDFWIAIIPMAVGFVLVLSQRWKLNVLSFGDEEARSLGVNTRVTRLIVILGATLITSTSVAVAGIVGWVGLVIPHFARAVVGPNYKVLLPMCLFMGAAYLLCIDDIARLLLSVEIPIGILTSILGVPFFLVIFRKTSRGW